MFPVVLGIVLRPLPWIKKESLHCLTDCRARKKRARQTTFAQEIGRQKQNVGSPAFFGRYLRELLSSWAAAIADHTGVVLDGIVRGEGEFLVEPSAAGLVGLQDGAGDCRSCLVSGISGIVPVTWGLTWDAAFALRLGRRRRPCECP